MCPKESIDFWTFHQFWYQISNDLCKTIQVSKHHGTDADRNSLLKAPRLSKFNFLQQKQTKKFESTFIECPKEQPIVKAIFVKAIILLKWPFLALLLSVVIAVSKETPATLNPRSLAALSRSSHCRSVSGFPVGSCKAKRRT